MVRSTDSPPMTIAVDLGHRATKPTNFFLWLDLFDLIRKRRLPIYSFKYKVNQHKILALVCLVADYFCFCFLFDLILYAPSTIFQLNRDGSSWVELVLS